MKILSVSRVASVSVPKFPVRQRFGRGLWFIGSTGPDDDCNGLDDDCDGNVDEGFVGSVCGQGVCTSRSRCINGRFFPASWRSLQALMMIAMA